VLPHGEAGSLSTQATAGDVMTSPVISVSFDAPSDHIAEIMTRHRISAVPVVDETGTVLGLVSQYDLLAKPGGFARELMSTVVITVSADCAIGDVRHLLIDRHIGRVPVVEQGRLVGIVSRGDVVALMATEWVCTVCGQPVRGDHAPTVCPTCYTSGDRFVLQEQPPGP
jgi:CBS domain-containing protein